MILTDIEGKDQKGRAVGTLKSGMKLRNEVQNRLQLHKLPPNIEIDSKKITIINHGCPTSDSVV